MWTCPTCNRKFNKHRQSHICVVKDVGELFLDKSDELVLAYDTLYHEIMAWQPNSSGAATHSIVFTNKRAWLIVKPMKSELDLKFYNDSLIESDQIRKTTPFGKHIGHHIRIQNEFQISNELLKLIRIGYDYGMR